MNRGKFIVFEGGDGSGKSTTLEKIYEFLVGEGIDCIKTREPGGIKISEDIRNIILDTKNTEMDRKTEALLYAAARRQHLVEKVIPALENGKIVYKSEKSWTAIEAGYDKYINTMFNENNNGFSTVEEYLAHNAEVYESAK